MKTLNTNDNIKAIVQSIRAEDNKLRKNHVIFSYQNTLGFLIFLSSVSAFIAMAALYYFNIIPAWLCIIAAAMIASITHEIEHDLIHRQYFAKQPIIYHFMMLIVWLIRPNTLNPWYRQKIHLHHHKVSGTQQDLEERLVGNGTVNPFFRLLVICDGLLGLIINRKQFKKEITDFSFFKVLNASFPVTTSYYIIMYTFIGFHVFDYINQIAVNYPQWLTASMDVIDFMMVVLIAPNFIRSASLNLVTSSMHYYGGVQNLLQQTQVLNSWVFMPFQLFCFNFGNTHGIHHFVPNQPFYIRQLISKKVLVTMKNHGVRFNDLHSLKQANYYSE